VLSVKLNLSLSPLWLGCKKHTVHWRAALSNVADTVFDLVTSDIWHCWWQRYCCIVLTCVPMLSVVILCLQFKYAKISSKINGSVKKGVIFSTYSSLIGESQAGGKYRTRLKQLVHWLGKEFDGLVSSVLTSVECLVLLQSVRMKVTTVCILNLPLHSWAFPDHVFMLLVGQLWELAPITKGSLLEDIARPEITAEKNAVKQKLKIVNTTSAVSP